MRRMEGFRLPKLFTVSGYTSGQMKMVNQFMFMYQKESLLLMQLKSGLQSQEDVFWQVMEVRFQIKN